jgi:ATP phosphoribosyltransferase
LYGLYGVEWPTLWRIATKYPHSAGRYFEDSGRQAEVVEVKGSVELAPLVGLADGIVDLVDTGRTLAENDLEIREEIAECLTFAVRTAPLRTLHFYYQQVQRTRLYGSLPTALDLSSRGTRAVQIELPLPAA